MKFSQLFTIESLKDPVDPRDVPILAKIDPEDIPVEITKELTPNLEEEEKETSDPFPDEYIPTTLASLRETVEAYNYTTSLAENNLNLLQSSLDVVREDSEISPMSMVSIVAQLETAADRSIVEDSEMVRSLADGLTSSNPYKYTSTMEALTKTLANMRPVVVHGISSLINVSNYLAKEIKLEQIIQELSTAHQRMKPSSSVTGEVSDINLDKVYLAIVDVLQDNISPENVPSIVADRLDEKLNIPVTACSVIRNGIEAITMTHSRELNNLDISSMVKFFKTVANVQKATLALLETVETHVNIENFNEVTLNEAINHYRHAVGVFWASVLHNAPEQDPSTKQRKFQVMENWPVLILEDSGKSELINLDIHGKHPIIPISTISDMVTFTINDIVPHFNAIAKTAQIIADKAKAIEQTASKVMTEQVSLTDETGVKFQDTFFRVVDAIKFSANLTMTAIESFDDVTEAIIDISKGIGILVEMK